MKPAGLSSDIGCHGNKNILPDKQPNRENTLD